jgi:hypothetical protein
MPQTETSIPDTNFNHHESFPGSQTFITPDYLAEPMQDNTLHEGGAFRRWLTATRLGRFTARAALGLGLGGALGGASVALDSYPAQANSNHTYTV